MTRPERAPFVDGSPSGPEPAASFDHGGESTSGLLGKLYDNPADSGTINFVPRPDWYFYFLFYLLRIFKWPESVILGTVGIPTVPRLSLIHI